MIDVPSLVAGILLGILLTGASLVLRELRRRHRSEYMSLDEVRTQIDADTVQRIEKWRDRKAEAERLSGKGVA